MKKEENDYTQKIQNVIKDFFDDFVYERNDFTVEEFNNYMIEYSKEIVNLILEKNNIKGNIEFKETHRVGLNGRMEYNEYDEASSTMYLNLENAYGNKDFNIFGLKSFNIKGRFKEATSFINTLIHETQHYIQEYTINKGIESNKAYSLKEKYLLSLEFANQRIGGFPYYNLGNNYRDCFLESDARISSGLDTIEYCKPVLNNLYKEISKGNIKGIDEKDIDKYILNLSGTRTLNDIYYANKLRLSKEDIHPKEALTTLADFSIAESPELLERYPMLKLEFNEDGSRKTLDELVTQRDAKILELNEQGKDTKEFKGLYNDILTNTICYTMSDKSLIEATRRLGKEKIKNLFEDLSLNSRENLDLQLQYLKNADDYAKQLNSGTFSLNDKYETRLDLVESSIKENNKEIENKISSKYDIVKNIRKFYTKQKDIDKSLANEIKENKDTAKIKYDWVDDFGKDMFFERYFNLKEKFKFHNLNRTPSNIGTVDRNKLRELKDTSKEYKRQIRTKEDILEESLKCINAAELLINDRFIDTQAKERDINMRNR